MKTLLLVVLTVFASMAFGAAEPDMPILSKKFANGASVWTMNDGAMILVVPPGLAEKPLIDEICNGQGRACLGRFVGEMWQLTPLK